MDGRHGRHVAGGHDGVGGLAGGAKHPEGWQAADVLGLVSVEPWKLTGDRVTLTSESHVAQVIEKQMGRLHPTPGPSWGSYRFTESVEPDDPSVLIRRKEILNLTDKLGVDGVLTCTLPAGDWTILYFGMVTTGKKNSPAAPEATGLEVDKLSRKHVEHHFASMIGNILKRLTPQERAAFTGITIDSYEVRSQNWTDDFDQTFKKRNGYDPIALLPVFTGREVDSAKASDQFLWICAGRWRTLSPRRMSAGYVPSRTATG